MLRTYSVHDGEIDKLSLNDWKPPLQLTYGELEIVRHPTSVLLLGRGGTGKTYCLCARMHRDQITRTDVRRALFVSHTKRLKENVTTIYEKMCDNLEISEDKQGSLAYATISDTMLQFYSVRLKLSVIEGRKVLDIQTAPLKFYEFRDNFYGTLTAQSKRYRDSRGVEIQMNALTAWTQIYSFIKGSVESVMAGRPLTREQYTDLNLIGKGRCKLDNEARNCAYTIFEKYQSWISSLHNRWDAQDLVIEVYQRLKMFLANGHEEALYNRVYVDEVQDMTQAELAVLILCTRTNKDALFFAGDTAQSIVNGVEFRFEEVRACFHKITEEELSLNKRHVLKTNFRSHDCILKISNSVLSIMREMFPDSFDDICGTNNGLALGPKPHFRYKSSTADILALIKQHKRIKILTWDFAVQKLREELEEERERTRTSDDPLQFQIMVLGFRNVKGLEFDDVALVDFFCTKDEISELQHKAWKFALSKAGKEPEQYRLPEVEMQLKVLYTAITRTRTRLFIIERNESQGGKAWYTFLKSKGDYIEDLGNDYRSDSEILRGDISSEEVKADDELMSNLEISIQGVEFAEQAVEEEMENEASVTLTINALKSFQFAKLRSNHQFIEKAKIQLKARKFQDILSKMLGGHDLSSCFVTDKLTGVPDGWLKVFIGQLNEQLSDFINGKDKTNINAIAAATANAFLQFGDYSTASTITAQYCKESTLTGLSSRLLSYKQAFGK